MPIEGAVAEILDRTTLVANVGEEDGVETGMKFQVYEEGPLIQDPETGEELGRPETVKVKVKASEVMENMTVMSTPTYTYEKDPMRDMFGSLGALGSTKVETKQQEMKTESSVREDRKKVRVGDSIREIVGKEDEEDQKDEQEQDGSS